MSLRLLRLAAIAVLALYVLAAAALLLTSDGWGVNRANVQVWFWTTGLLGMRHLVTPEQFAVVANVLLFIPAFAALAVLRPTWWWVAVGAASSAAVEFYQLSLGTRHADVWDIVMNTLGAALGVAAGLGLRRRLLSGDAGDPSPADPTATTTPVAARVGSAHGPAGGRDGRD